MLDTSLVTRYGAILGNAPRMKRHLAARLTIPRCRCPRPRVSLLWSRIVLKECHYVFCYALFQLSGLTIKHLKLFVHLLQAFQKVGGVLGQFCDTHVATRIQAEAVGFDLFDRSHPP